MEKDVIPANSIWTSFAMCRNCLLYIIKMKNSILPILAYLEAVNTYFTKESYFNLEANRILSRYCNANMCYNCMLHLKDHTCIYRFIKECYTKLN